MIFVLKIEILNVGDEKFRLDPNKDVPSGYRDVQLSCKLKSKISKDYKVDNHISELQLHLKEINDIKSESGHKLYKFIRNLKGY